MPKNPPKFLKRKINKFPQEDPNLRPLFFSICIITQSAIDMELRIPIYSEFFYIFYAEIFAPKPYHFWVKMFYFEKNEAANLKEYMCINFFQNQLPNFDNLNLKSLFLFDFFYWNRIFLKIGRYLGIYYYSFIHQSIIILKC